MNNSKVIPTQQKSKQIGILLADLGKLNVAALKYLVLHMNILQQTFEYEFLPSDDNDEFLLKLSTQKKANREEIESGVRDFLKRYKTFLKQEIMGYDMWDTAIPDDFILITMAHFEDRYYSTREGNLSILALGNWKRTMAPPSIIEFMLSLIIRESISIVCPSLANSVHIGTKGCICDFTAYLSDARIKVLSGFVCHHCRSELEVNGFDNLASEVVNLLKKDWLGKSTDPYTPAGTVSNLGYDLFITKGLTTTGWERARNLLTDEVLRQFISTIAAIITGILIAFLLVRFGLKQ